MTQIIAVYHNEMSKSMKVTFAANYLLYVNGKPRLVRDLHAPICLHCIVVLKQAVCSCWKSEDIRKMYRNNLVQAKVYNS